MMSGVKPLLVFEYGKTELSAGKIYEKSQRIDGTVFENKIIAVYSDRYRTSDIETGGYVIITGIDFTKYRKLFIECCHSLAKEYDGFLEAGYGSNTVGSGISGAFTESKKVPEEYEVLSFDISKIKGENYIKAVMNVNGETDNPIRIKNIRLE